MYVKEPFKTHITVLKNVRSKLDWSLSMSGRQSVLSERNEARRRLAAEKINDAIRILSGIEGN